MYISTKTAQWRWILTYSEHREQQAYKLTPSQGRHEAAVFSPPLLFPIKLIHGLSTFETGSGKVSKVDNCFLWWDTTYYSYEIHMSQIFAPIKVYLPKTWLWRKQCSIIGYRCEKGCALFVPGPIPGLMLPYIKTAAHTDVNLEKKKCQHLISLLRSPIWLKA